ncbi:MAG: RNA 2'-phosphotransferase [Candidatus Lokiarchaeota archaeon]|nr:RNA 2'-phosphotransferase [Candidatus Lokiarchaeota archaeon]
MTKSLNYLPKLLNISNFLLFRPKLSTYYVEISKFLSYILRHHPEKYGIRLNEEGYANLEHILAILNSRFDSREITRDTLEKMIKNSDKTRFELTENYIRAYYGHSIDSKIQMSEARQVPARLYHGTTPKAYVNILKDGLRTQERQYVHLSKDIETAKKVGKRRTNNPVILIINTKKAKKEGIVFYKSGDMFLADYIPPKFISILNRKDIGYP